MKIIKIIAVLIILVGVSLFGANQFVHHKVEKELIKYIEKTKTYADVTYESFDISILKKELKLNNVTIIPTQKVSKDSKPIVIESLEIGNFNLNEAIPKNIKFNAKGLKLSKNFLGTTFLDGLGYDETLKSSFSLWFKYDETTGDIGYEDLSIQIDNVGTLAMSIGFGNCFLDEDKMAILRGKDVAQDYEIESAIVDKAVYFDFFKDGSSYRDLTLKHYSLSFTDNSLVDRLLDRKAAEANISRDQLKDQIMMMVKMVASMQVEVLSKKESLATIEKFIKDTDNIKLSIVAKEPFKIFEIIDPDADDALGGDFKEEQSIQDQILDKVEIKLEN